MYLSLGKLFGKSKLRFGMGIRITKKNFAYMLIPLFIWWSLVACWYMLLLCFWLCYAIGYVFYISIKGLVNLIKRNIKKSKKTPESAEQ